MEVIIGNIGNSIFHLSSDFSSIHMDYRELQEIRKVLRAHEDTIQGNISSILTTTTKIHEQDQ